MFPMQQNEVRRNLRINSLTLNETGTYNPMYFRPYTTQMTPGKLQDLTGRVEQAGGSTITGTLLSGLVSETIKPSAVAMGEVPIPLGWVERRMRFFMEVVEETSTGTPSIYYIQGYTSHLGVSPQTGEIDPRMEFIINSYIRVNRAQQYTPAGLQYRDIVTESAHVINGQIIHQAVPQDFYKLRPMEIFAGIQSNYWESANAQRSNENQVIDTRIRLGNESVRSNRNNNLPANFAAKVIDSYQTGSRLAEFGQSNSDIISRSRDLTNESSVYENPFIRMISNIRGIPGCTMFTIKELKAIQPDVPIKYITLGQTELRQLHQAGQTAYWNGADRTTLVATMLSNAVPAIMMDLMIRRIHFRSTNHEMAGQMNTILYGAQSMTSVEMAANYEMFKQRLQREVLYDITFGNQELYMLDMSSNLFGETTITLSLGNEAQTTFTTPSFCDSLLTPVVTPDKHNFFAVVHDFEVLMNELGQSGSHSPIINQTV